MDLIHLSLIFLVPLVLMPKRTKLHMPSLSFCSLFMSQPHGYNIGSYEQQWLLNSSGETISFVSYANLPNNLFYINIGTQILIIQEDSGHS